MIIHSDNYCFEVTRHQPESATEQEAVQASHPRLKELAIAGISAVVAATGTRLPQNRFMATSPDALTPTVDFATLLAGRTQTERQLALRGAHMLELVQATSGLLVVDGRDPARSREKITKLDVKGLDVPKLRRNITILRALVKAGTSSQHGQCSLRLTSTSGGPGHGDWLSMHSQHNTKTVTVRVSSGPIINHFPDTLPGDQFGIIEGFVLAIHAALADRQ